MCVCVCVCVCVTFIHVSKEKTFSPSEITSELDRLTTSLTRMHNKMAGKYDDVSVDDEPATYRLTLYSHSSSWIYMYNVMHLVHVHVYMSIFGVAAER